MKAELCRAGNNRFAILAWPIKEGTQKLSRAERVYRFDAIETYRNAYL